MNSLYIVYILYKFCMFMMETVFACIFGEDFLAGCYTLAPSVGEFCRTDPAKTRTRS